MIGSLVVLGGLIYLIVAAPADPTQTGQPQSAPLLVYCAASNKSVQEAIARDFQQQYGVTVQFQFGPSQTLLTGLEVSRQGELYLPADDSYLTVARERNLIDAVYPLAEMRVVVAVPKGNPKHIASLADLLRDDMRLCQANPDTAAIGKVTKARLLASGQWDTLKQHTTVFKTAVNEVANDVKVGTVYAGIVYDVVLHDYEDLEGVSIPELADIVSRIAIARLKSSRQPERAEELARYMMSADGGQTRYREFGFTPTDLSPSP